MVPLVRLYIFKFQKEGFRQVSVTRVSNAILGNRLLGNSKNVRGGLRISFVMESKGYIQLSGGML